jgi:hypothetical protein
MIETIETGSPKVVDLKPCGKPHFPFRSLVDSAWSWLTKNEGPRTTKRAVRPVKVCEKSDLWNGYPWFGI